MGFLVFHSFCKATKNSFKIATWLVLLLLGAELRAQTTGPASVIPKTLTGYALDDIVSCAFIDKIPWRFRPDGRKTRLLIRDTLRIYSESKSNTWEVHQVMDKEGFVTFIFRRPLSNGQWESIVSKDSAYNRFIGNQPGKRRMAEKQNLQTLIDRPALTFENAKGSSIALVPGSVGNSALSIQLSQAEGRMLPPVFIRGSTCTRPDSDDNSGATGAPAAPAAAKKAQ